ncbi:MAG: POTRA domain-containing protein [Candidatus Neomarinimicrobiota bacterium]
MTFPRLQFLLVPSLCLVLPLQGQLKEKGYIVDQIQFEGNQSFSSRQLKGVIKLKEPFLVKSSEFNRRSLKLDAITLKNFYLSRGFQDATVEESFTVSEEGRVDVLFRITEGDRSYLESVTVQGNELLSDERIVRILGLEIGEPFNPVGVRQGFSELQREYGNLGKLLVVVESGYPPGEEIHLTLTITEGPTVKIGRIIIGGLSRVDSSIVSRELEIVEGTVYNDELVELSQRQIFETGLFSFVDIIPEKSPDAEDLVNIRVELKEFTVRELFFEPGLALIGSRGEGEESVSGGEVTVQWLDRSSFGTGLRLRAKASVQFPLEPVESAFGKAILRSEATLSSLWIHRWRAPSSLRLFLVRFQDDFFMRIGGEWNVLHVFSEESSIRGGLRWSIIDVKTGEQEQEHALRFSYRHRRLDSPIFPSRGTRFTVESSIVGWLLGGARDYYRVEVDYRRYFPFGSSAVLALRTKLGLMGGLGKNPNIPSYGEDPTRILLYLGGSTSLRGWAPQRFLTDEDHPKGGLTKALINAELRIPLIWILGLDLFLDAGTLDDKIGWDYGAELTVTTPLGPIRLYYAIPFGEPVGRGIINLGVPYAF